MSIVVTTPTGNIGRVVTDRLLDAGATVTVIARHPEKVAAFAERGARVVEGTHRDPEVLARASEGAKALFLLTPPDFLAHDVVEHYRPFGEAAAEAIRRCGVRHVVHLSSVGADLDHGNGPVKGLFHNEAILRESGAAVLQLRPGYFMENTLGQIGPIKQAGHLFTTLPGDLPIPMIATRDIGVRAAELLLTRDWSHEKVLELQGFGAIGYDDVAAILSETLGREVTHVRVTADQAKAALMSMGVGEPMAEAVEELSRGLHDGLVRFHEPRSEDNTTPTSYKTFASDVFKPIFESA